MKDKSVEQLFEDALEAGRGRDYDRAIGLLQAVLVQTDQFPAAVLYLGRAYHASGDLNRAIQALQYFLKIQPQSAEGHFFLGRAYFALGLLGPAFRHLDRSTSLEGSFVPALGLLGLTLLKRGRPQAAISVFERALSLEPDNQRVFTGYLNSLLTQGIRLFHRRHYQEARDALLFIRKHRPDSLVAHLYLASIYRELGEVDQSLFHFEEAAHLAPKDPVLHLQKAVLLLQRGDSSTAYEEMTQAMRMLGSDTISAKDAQSLLRIMTIVLFQNRRYGEALESARRVLRASYHDADMHAIMAEAFHELGDLKKSKNHYLRALEADRNRLEFNYGLTAVLWARGEYGQLRSVLARILRINPQDPFALYYRALSLPYLDDDFRNTIPLLQEQIRRSGPDAHLMNALGQEYLRADLPDLAEGWLKRTLNRVSDFEQALEKLIEVYRRLEDKAKLMGAYAEYLNHYPDNLDLRRDYSELLYGEGRFAEACSQLEALVPHEPKNKDLRVKLAHSYRQSSRYPEAVLLYRQLILEAPKSLDLVRSLVFCLEKSSGRETVILLLEKALKFFREDAWLQHRLGALYMREGRLEKAAQMFRGLVGSNPRDWQAYESLSKLYRKMGNTGFAERFRRKADELKAENVKHSGTPAAARRGKKTG